MVVCVVNALGGFGGQEGTWITAAFQGVNHFLCWRQLAGELQFDFCLLSAHLFPFCIMQPLIFNIILDEFKHNNFILDNLDYNNFIFGTLYYNSFIFHVFDYMVFTDNFVFGILQIRFNARVIVTLKLRGERGHHYMSFSNSLRHSSSTTFDQRSRHRSAHRLGHRHPL